MSFRSEEETAGSLKVHRSSMLRIIISARLPWKTTVIIIYMK